MAHCISLPLHIKSGQPITALHELKVTVWMKLIVTILNPSWMDFHVFSYYPNMYYSHAWNMTISIGIFSAYLHCFENFTDSYVPESSLIIIRIPSVPTMKTMQAILYSPSDPELSPAISQLDECKQTITLTVIAKGWLAEQKLHLASHPGFNKTLMTPLFCYYDLQVGMHLDVVNFIRL